jgi:hypothetical protein
MEYRDYAYSIVGGGVHSYDDAVLTVRHKLSGMEKSITIKSIMMPGNPISSFIRKLVKEINNDLNLETDIFF